MQVILKRLISFFTLIYAFFKLEGTFKKYMYIFNPHFFLLCFNVRVLGKRQYVGHMFEYFLFTHYLEFIQSRCLKVFEYIYLCGTRIWLQNVFSLLVIKIFHYLKIAQWLSIIMKHWYLVHYWILYTSLYNSIVSLFSYAGRKIIAALSSSFYIEKSSFVFLRDTCNLS